MVKKTWIMLAAAVVLAAQGGLSAPLELTMPDPATDIGGRVENPARYQMPTGAFASGSVPTITVTGDLSQRAYRLDSTKLTTLQIMTALRQQVTQAGYSIAYECDTSACGGFDFRFRLDVLPEPQMHVDLGDFRYLEAARGTEAVSVLVSRSANQGFVQVTMVDSVRSGPDAQTSPATADPAPVTDPPVASPPVATPPDPVPASGSFDDRLTTRGAVALDDLIFPSGKAALEDKDYASLADLAVWLTANPARKVVLVGHTDASGTLTANIALSKQRAQSVRAWLIQHYGAAAAQIDAQGAGYLSPRDTNLTDAGRTRNRRVEVVLTSTP